MEASDITPKHVTYTKRPRGGYYVTVTLDDGRWFRLVATESAPWQRTTEYYRWTARSLNSKGPVGHARTRIGAIRDALHSKLN